MRWTIRMEQLRRLRQGQKLFGFSLLRLLLDMQRPVEVVQCFSRVGRLTAHTS